MSFLQQVQAHEIKMLCRTTPDVVTAVFYSFYRCTMHSDIHTVHSPTDAHLLEL